MLLIILLPAFQFYHNHMFVNPFHAYVNGVNMSHDVLKKKIMGISPSLYRCVLVDQPGLKMATNE